MAEHSQQESDRPLALDSANSRSCPEKFLTVLVIATRDPRGRMTGRKIVLNTIVASLSGLGHYVFVGFFGAVEGETGDTEVRFVPLPSPRLHEIMLNIVGGFFPGRKSLNECLYASRAAGAVLAKLAREEAVDLVVVDMIRTAGYGEELGKPWIVDFDDLLSLRYERMADSSMTMDGAGPLLGYYQSPSIRFLMRMAAPFLRLVLHREAKIIRKREIAVARSASLSSTVSPIEANELARVAGTAIEWTPMAIAGPKRYSPLSQRAKHLVFLGGLDYLPNWQSMVDFSLHTLPDLTARGVAVQLDIIGAPKTGSSPEWPDVIRQVGYLENLDRALQEYKAMLVPGGLRGGLKTKIIHAALNGTIILSHPDAIEGTGLRPGHDFLVWSSAEELAAQLRRIETTDPALAKMVRNARFWAEQNFSPQALQDKWASHTRAALRKPLR